MKKNQVIVLITGVCIIGIMLFFLWPRKDGDIVKANRTIPQSELYSEQDIADAMDIVEKEFKSTFVGCTLTDLWYDEAISISSSNAWAGQYNADEAIVLLSDFDVDSSGGDGSLEPNETYMDWQWILVRDKKSGIWELETWGYG